MDGFISIIISSLRDYIRKFRRYSFFLLFYASEYLCVAALVLLVFALLLSLACLHLFLVCLYPLRRRGVRRTGWVLIPRWQTQSDGVDEYID